MMADIDHQAQMVPVTEQDLRWAAVVTRDRTADDRFVYSVATTGVFCRPSCPSRLARPEHVRFHPTCAGAEQAGYRPCRRCRPTIALTDRQVGP